jgi:SAM-dependent methyltransferase
MRRLVAHLNIPLGSNVLDIPCGNGRHAVFLHSLGLEVTGVDLSIEHIKRANDREQAGLYFRQADMRMAQETGPFQLILNLFTSLGYFETKEEDQITLTHLAEALAPKGYLVIDFLNIELLVKTIVSKEEKIEEGVQFHIERCIEDGLIVKKINVKAGLEEHHYCEKVRAYTLADFQRMLPEVLEIKSIFGNYELGTFHTEHSPRLIIIAQKR